MKAVLAILGALSCWQAVTAAPRATPRAVPNYFGGFGGFGSGCGCGVEVVEPVIPVCSGLVNQCSFVDSFQPGSSYCGFGTYGPAYGGFPYPLEVFGGYGGGFYN